ncbi:FAD-binding oxidoreductase [Achromobacter animicus]|uniref:FAD-binding oxidoreductase n=1 Tax=Achromobacter animicus TaxID=1389935 RepID=UPI0024498B28|nr:FAD-binding oxidoreductase [Achromobacter animicus]MDH0683060.1 FAD-binding oxidoreductase [Achromobacter animicus]
MKDLLSELRTLVGPVNVLTDEDDKASYETEWRGRIRGNALAVIRPGTIQEAQTVVRLCAAQLVAIVPQGGNTGLAAGAIPDLTGSQVILSLSRLNSVRRVDRANMTATVEAGCTLQALRETLATEGLLFPLSLGSEGTCTIGGNLATNAGGAQALRYGNARDLCLGLEYLTADGSLVSELGGLRKDNTGFDLRNVVIGSEGCLAIITAATLKIQKKAPTATLCAWVGVKDVDDAVNLLQLSQSTLGTAVSCFEIMNRASLELVARAFPQASIPFLENQDVSQWVLLQLTALSHTKRCKRKWRMCWPMPWTTLC